MIALDRSWQVAALCRGNRSHLFFPPSTAEKKEERQRREQRAKAVCQVCPVKDECLDYAVTVGEAYGIWGGLSEMERRHSVVRSAAI